MGEGITTGASMRAPGFYWVRQRADDPWEIWQYVDETVSYITGWLECGSALLCDDPEVIGPRVEPPG